MNIKPMTNPQPPRLSLFLYLIPILGFFPALWALYRRHGNASALAVSRLSVTLTLTWLIGYLLLTVGAETSAFFSLRLLILNSFFTSSYFVVSVWLMWRLATGNRAVLPGFSRFSQRLLD